MDDERDFFLEDLLYYYGENLMYLSENDDFYISDGEVLKEFSYYTVTVPYRDTKLSFYQVFDSNEDFTGYLYSGCECEYFAHIIIFGKNDSGIKFCEKIYEDDLTYLPRLVNIDGKTAKLMICNDFEGMIACFKQNYIDYLAKKNGKKKKINECVAESSGVDIIKQKVEKQKNYYKKSEEKIDLPQNAQERNNRSILGAINYSISFFENNFKNKQEGELHLDCKGKKGHHFPSITVTALKVASLYAPFSLYTKAPKNEWLRDLQVNLKDGENIESILKKLREKKSEIEKML